MSLPHPRLLAGFLLALSATLALFLGVNAQTNPGCTMSGYVLDPQGRGVGEAEVVLKVSGRAIESRVVTNRDGSYTIQLPSTIERQETGYMYARLVSGEVVIVGHINFKHCRTRRDIFTSQPSGVGYEPGPTPPSPPPVVPAYPGPDSPAPSLANAVAFFDLTALGRGGVSPGENFALPICIAALTSSVPQVSKLTFIAEYDPSKITIRRITRLRTSPFTGDAVVRYGPTTQPVPREGGRIRGRIWYEVDSSTLVELPPLPACIRIADVEMEVANAPTVNPGDTLGFSTIKGVDPETLQATNPSMRIGGFEGAIARTTTYLDILTPAEQQEVLKKSFIPLIIKNRRLQPTALD